MSSFAVEALKDALAKAENQCDQALRERDKAQEVAREILAAWRNGWPFRDAWSADYPWLMERE